MNSRLVWAIAKYCTTYCLIDCVYLMTHARIFHAYFDLPDCKKEELYLFIVSRILRFR